MTQPSKLLDNQGHLTNKGWSRHQLLQYNRENIGVRWYRIKEWDYYAIIGPKFGITITIADLGIMALFSVVWLDFEKGTFTTGEVSKLFTRGKTNLPSNSKEGNIKIKTKKLQIEVIKTPDTRELSFSFPKFAKNMSLEGKLVLHQPPEMESVTIATPWNGSPKAFYYNQKINCMPTKGYVNINEDKYDFDPSSSFSVLDWGRGVWTYKNTWFWGSASGIVNNESFGFNIGYGFGDTAAASENIIFYKNVGHKIEEVEFHYNPDDYLQPWKFTSSDSRFEMTFEPILDRNAKVNLFIFKSVQHQVFGYFTGFVILDDGTKLEVNKLLGFAEEVYNRW
ncbi:MAG: DUF2804 domain-containing protein [Candidatus Heimdallarchaeota archaeon]|nr:DUF2804 domain-containing protein [Candidatus Heimdallarchaeota archaeon]